MFFNYPSAFAFSNNPVAVLAGGFAAEFPEDGLFPIYLIVYQIKNILKLNLSVKNA